MNDHERPYWEMPGYTRTALGRTITVGQLATAARTYHLDRARVASTCPHCQHSTDSVAHAVMCSDYMP